jgi:LysM repeat protein
MKLKQTNKSKYSCFATRLFTGGAIGVLMIVGALTFSKTAHASLISLVSSLFVGESVSAKVNQSTSTSANSQTVALLQAAVNSDPNPEKSSDVVPVNNNDTLVADLASDNSAGTDTSNMQISTYIVRQGDTISGVAKMFKVTTNTILWANDLSSKSSLKEGQTLVILPISGITYTIKKGDTIKGIALRYKADVQDILNYNDITIGTPIVAGQTLILPDAELAAPSAIIASKPSNAGYYIRPIVGGRKSQGIHGHNAVDLAAPIGTKILASAAGTVVISKMDGGWNGAYGNYIVVSHSNGTQTLYSHMRNGTVSVGQTVSQGQVIGYIGMTGKTTGPHVHFEIRGAQNPF